MIKTIYLNLEDDIPKITARLKQEKARNIVLVFPKKSFLFSDSINLRLLKKQTDLLQKEVSILTMDEVGQIYAKEAGFALRFLHKQQQSRGIDDIRTRPKASPEKETTPFSNTERELIESQYNNASTKTTPISEHTPRVIPKIISNNSAELHKTITQSDAKPNSGTTKTHNAYKKIMLGFVGLSIIVIIILVLVILPRADVSIYAKNQAISQDIQISAATAIKEADDSRLVMPAVAVEKTLEGKNKYNGAGKKEVGSKAQGSIVIYNLTGKPLNLRAATTTLSVNNKTYVFTEDQNNIKPATLNTNTDTLPAAEIIATSGGEAFNLPSGTRLEITNQVFGGKPKVLYAKTKTTITGGTSRFISVITQEDIQKAQSALTNSLVAQLRAELKEKNLVLTGDAFTTETLSFTTDKSAGTESPSFEANAKLKITGLAFDETILKDLIRSRISNSFSPNKQLQNVSDDTMQSTAKSLDISTGVLLLQVHYESKAIYTVDTDDIIPKIAGKTKEEASEILLAKPEIDHIDITLSPSWQNSIPRFSGKVHVEIK